MPPLAVRKALKAKGYKRISEWRKLSDEEQFACDSQFPDFTAYLKKGLNYFIVTAAYSTGLYSIEISKQHEEFRVSIPWRKISNRLAVDDYDII